MNTWLLLPSLYVAAAVESALGAQCTPGWTPNLLAIVLVAWSLSVTEHRAVVGAACCGLVCELIGAGRLGPGVAAFAIAGYALSQSSAHLPAAGPLMVGALVGPVTFVVQLALGASAFATGVAEFSFVTLLSHALSVAIITAAVTAPLVGVCLAWQMARRRRVAY